MIHTPIANLRWLGSQNMLRISDSVDGASVAPATPRTARAAISSSAFGAYAAITEATPNAVAPIINRRRLPIRSPRVPMVMRNPASRNP